jgi:hypothetical protein
MATSKQEHQSKLTQPTITIISNGHPDVGAAVDKVENMGLDSKPTGDTLVRATSTSKSEAPAFNRSGSERL